MSYIVHPGWVCLRVIAHGNWIRSSNIIFGMIKFIPPKRHKYFVFCIHLGNMCEHSFGVLLQQDNIFANIFLLNS